MSPSPLKFSKLGPSLQYSTLTQSSRACAGTLSKDLANFLEWFRGFVDGEGSFIILKNRNNFIFSFSIGLHVDDTNVLFFIKKHLQIGSVTITGKASYFRVTKQEEVLKIIEIFQNLQLNTTKHLNFLAFEEAFSIYVGPSLHRKKRKKTLELKKKIENIRCSMNKERLNFNMPENHIRISRYWLLGFIEAEGSFSVTERDYRLIFSLSQSEVDLILMQEIKNFFNSLAQQTNTSSYNSKSISFSSYKRYVNSRYSIINLKIKNKDFIANVLIPFFDSMIFFSKKGLDFQDWKSIFKLKELGQHYSQEGIKVIDLILSQMNNRRLSTNSSHKIDRTTLTNKVEKLLNEPSNLEIRENGKIWIKSLNRYKRGSNYKSIKVKLQESDGLVINTFNSISSCARFLGIVPSTAKVLLDNNKSILLNNKHYFIKKVKNEDFIE